MSQKVKKQTYAAFIVPDKSAPQKGIAVPFAVESRNLGDLDVPAAACAFYFYDAPAGLTPAESLLQQEKISKVYLLAHETLNRTDVKKLVAGDQFENFSNRMQWDPRIDAHDVFILTRSNAIQPVTDRHIVINARREQIYPAVSAPKPTYNAQDITEVFNPMLQKDVLVPKLGAVRRRPPTPPPAP
ncbi:MAG: hypothetical protein ACK4PK_09305 [Alphaproteobacteria bacterium]